MNYFIMIGHLNIMRNHTHTRVQTIDTYRKDIIISLRLYLRTVL